jgi:hypothetical protein
MQKRSRTNIKKRVTKEPFFQERTLKDYPLITNIPLTENGRLVMERAEIEDSGKLFKRFHRRIQTVLSDERGNPYLREVLE